MTTDSAAENAAFNSLKKQAKTFLKALKAGDPAVRQRALAYFSDPSAMGLQDVQLVLAREEGFSSWTKLKAHFASGSDGEAADQQVNRFLSLAMVSYFSRIPADPARFDQALELARAHPEIARQSLPAAVALGDAAEVERHLSKAPQDTGRKSGPFDWPPLLYAAYARVPGHSSFEAAKVLLAHGADPNAFYMDDGQYRFTALTGVFGEGEAGKERQPEHPDCIAFARLLLDAGAEPNDSQALYNRMFEPDDRCLELLLEYGLTAQHRNNWMVREDGKLVENSEQTLSYQFAWALQQRMPGRVRLLARHGVDVSRPVNGRTPYEWAMLGGDADLAGYLVSKGAAPVEMRDTDLLARAINGNRREEAERLVAADRSLVERTGAAHPALLHEAAASNLEGPVRLMLALGFDVNRMTSRTPLHEAALHGHLEMVKLLIVAGADPKIRDPYHLAPPIGWADYNGHQKTVDYLLGEAMDIFAAAAFGREPYVAGLLDAEPELLDLPFGTFRPRGRPDPERDWLTPVGFAIINRREAMVRFLIGRGANLSVRNGAGENLRALARRHGMEAALTAAS